MILIFKRLGARVDLLVYDIIIIFIFGCGRGKIVEDVVDFEV